MVDINLMGEDENSEERQRETSFAKTVSLDDAILKDEPPVFKETGAKTFQKQPPAPKFARKPSELYGDSSSRTKAYLIVLGLILAALTAVFFLIPRGPKKPPIIVQKEEPLTIPPETTQETPAESLTAPSSAEPPMVAETETPPPAPVNTPSTTSQAPAPNAMATKRPPAPSTPPPSTSALSPLERDLISSAWLSTQTVNALANSFSAANNFTLITYYGNNSFLVEFVSPSATSTSELTGAIQRNVSPMQLKTVSQASVPTDAGLRSTVVLSGKMDPQAGMAGLRGGLNRMGASQFAEWVKQQGKSSGLALKRFTVGTSANEDNFGRVPMQIQFSGSRANVLSFLNTLGSGNFSVSVSKIIVSPSDRRTLSSDVLDVVLHLGYVEM